MCTNASEGMSFPYLSFRACVSATNHAATEGATQFGMLSDPAGAWNGAPPWESKNHKIASGVPVSSFAFAKMGT